MTVWQLELPVPIYEQSEDSIRFSLVTSRRNCKALLPRSALLVCFRRRVTRRKGTAISLLRLAQRMQGRPKAKGWRLPVLEIGA